MELTTVYLSNLVNFHISVLVMKNRLSNETYQDIFGRHLEHQTSNTERKSFNALCCHLAEK